jgi:hypothetical protein
MHQTAKMSLRALALLACCLPLGCSGGASTGPVGHESSLGSFPTRAARAATTDGCRVDRDPAGANRLRRSFVSESDAPVRLLLAGTAVRPGGQMRLALANDSGQVVYYGVGTNVKSEATGKQIHIRGMITPLPLLTTQPHALGSCDTALIPSNTAPGRYRVTKSVEIGSHPGPSIKDQTVLSAEFDVKGKPLAHSEWEAQLRRVREENRQRRTRQKRADSNG